MEATGRYLPEDLWWDIFARLPLHSLCTTMAVSKPMRYLAKAAFAQRPRLGFQGETHSRRAAPDFYIFSDDGRKVFYSGLYYTDLQLIRLRVCNGFLLMSTAVGYCIINPLNGRTFTLPRIPDINHINEKIRLIGNTMLAFDPRLSPHYKVVTFWFQLGPGPHKYVYADDVAIFSSKTREWGFSQLNFNYAPGTHDYLGVSDDQSVCIGEFVYRLNKTLLYGVWVDLKLLVFKAEEENFELVNLPESLTEIDQNRRLVDLTTIRSIGESMSTLQFLYQNLEDEILIWSLERDGGHGSYNWIFRIKICFTTKLRVISGFAPHPSIDAMFVNLKIVSKQMFKLYTTDHMEDAHDTFCFRYEDEKSETVLRHSCRADPFLFCLNDPDLDRESMSLK